jgi:hypothetical protein
MSLLDSKMTIIEQPKKASKLNMDDRSVFFAKVKWELCFLYIINWNMKEWLVTAVVGHIVESQVAHIIISNHKIELHLNLKILYYLSKTFRIAFAILDIYAGFITKSAIPKNSVFIQISKIIWIYYLTLHILITAFPGANSL